MVKLPIADQLQFAVPCTNLHMRFHTGGFSADSVLRECIYCAATAPPLSAISMIISALLTVVDLNLLGGSGYVYGHGSGLLSCFKKKSPRQPSQ